jgi:hypothetical protein
MLPPTMPFGCINENIKYFIQVVFGTLIDHILSCLKQSTLEISQVCHTEMKINFPEQEPAPGLAWLGLHLQTFQEYNKPLLREGGAGSDPFVLILR